MYAVFQAMGRQYRVSAGEELMLDYMGDKKVGDTVKFDQVLMVGGEKTSVGAPIVAGASVEAIVKNHTRLPKVLAFHYRRRKNSKKSHGHRQSMTVVEIKKISL